MKSQIEQIQWRKRFKSIISEGMKLDNQSYVWNLLKTFFFFDKKESRDLKEKTDNNIKDFLQTKDLQKQNELILNFSREQRKNVFDYSFIHLDLHEYVLRVVKL